MQSPKFILNYKKIKSNLVNFYFYLIIIIGIPANLFFNRFYYKNDWTIGEWLINYNGGFVRRGLPGQVIFYISKYTYISPILIIWTISLLSFFSLIFLLNKLCNEKLSSQLLISSILITSPIIGDYLIRKDVFGLTLMGFILLILDSIKNNNKIKNFFIFIVINFFIIFAILSHESFAFYGLPGLFLCKLFLENIDKNTNKIVYILAQNILFFSPSLISFLAVLIYKGDYENIVKIHDSWIYISNLLPWKEKIIPENLPGGAIGALAWTTNKGLSLSIDYLDEFSGIIWVPLAVVFTIILFANIFIGDKNGVHKDLKRSILLFQLFSISPLFFLGRDFGRWIFIWMCSSSLIYGFILNLNIKNNNKKFFKLPRIISKIFFGISLTSNQKWIYLILSAPLFGWSINYYIASTPLIAPFNFLRMFLDLSWKQIYCNLLGC